LPFDFSSYTVAPSEKPASSGKFNNFLHAVEAVNEAAAGVAEILGRSGTNEAVSFAVDMAVREAVTNAVLHGNKKDQSKAIRVKVKRLPESVEISIEDEGPGFNPEIVPDCTAPENVLKSSGRGIFFIRNFMDEVEWFVRPGGGTTVRMMKRF